MPLGIRLATGPETTMKVSVINLCFSGYKHSNWLKKFHQPIRRFKNELKFYLWVRILLNLSFNIWAKNKLENAPRTESDELWITLLGTCLFPGFGIWWTRSFENEPHYWQSIKTVLHTNTKFEVKWLGKSFGQQNDLFTPSSDHHLTRFSNKRFTWFTDLPTGVNSNDFFADWAPVWDTKSLLPKVPGR